MKLVIIGIQGSGKSTQGNLLSKQLGIPYLSTGHIFRQLAKEKTKLGHYIKVVMNTGLLIPDEKTIEIVNSYLFRPEYKGGYILDGFPRTINQAKKFINNVDKVIYLEIPDKEAIYRLVYRDSQAREDETIPAIKKRIESFKKFTLPVLDFYRKQKKLVEIDGIQTIETVNQEILKSLGKQLVKNKIENWAIKNKKIIAIVGLPGVGKTDATDFFKKQGIPSISFGQIINEYIEKNHLPHIEKTHKKVRLELRQKHGMAALAIMNEGKIKKALNDNMIVVIDGVRSWQEYLHLKKTFPEVKIYLLAIHADKHLRWSRSIKRSHRNKLYGEDRDLDELIGINMAPTIAYADFLVKNNFSLQDFHDKLEEVYRTVYYS
ncbi:MAG: Adenylate kinase [Candidatus Roizmanbacteria bacterium GW2011_GWC2_37_13]|uniref:Adenylate kinase n=1 Tax=Candidatus Roizmanbacteria bacterium GW2011_GWC2_37_13 TaxID=1618486 RepID=A0A0G0G9H6_9BACT|nr:MAG: adenylate kinase, adenylate kinase [Candidatus Roizmanbacteria bacterium GW2011_GWC1_37_12]KKQ26622.1 MAG: Adenylate kinase [Candidatus Roizmanbacteria bacterium GW2011_GWC2_37_13]